MFAPETDRRCSLLGRARCKMIPDDPHNRPKLYTVKEAAKFLGCSERKLRSEIKAGTITYRRPPEGYRFAEEDLLDRLRPRGGPGAKKGFKDPLKVRHNRQSPTPNFHTGNIVRDISGSTPACVLSTIMVVVFGNQKPGFHSMEVQSS